MSFRKTLLLFFSMPLSAVALEFPATLECEIKVKEKAYKWVPSDTAKLRYARKYTEQKAMTYTNTFTFDEASGTYYDFAYSRKGKGKISSFMIVMDNYTHPRFGKTTVESMLPLDSDYHFAAERSDKKSGLTISTEAKGLCKEVELKPIP